MGEETARLKYEIEQTRENLTRDVDLLADKTSPSRIMERRVDRTRQGIAGIKERVMGSQSHSVRGNDVAGSLVASASSVSQGAHAAVSTVSDTAHDAVSGARRHTDGSPLAAGLVAFGVGWLIASLLPISEAEKETTRRVGDQAKQHAGPVLDQVKQSGQDVADNLKGSLHDAADQVQETAQSAVQTVRTEGASAASSVTDEAHSPSV